MKIFNIGDRVRHIIDNRGVPTGEEGVVIRLWEDYSNTRTPISIKWDIVDGTEGKSEKWWSAEEFELAPMNLWLKMRSYARDL
jgi:hypothetical protein